MDAMGTSGARIVVAVTNERCARPRGTGELKDVITAAKKDTQPCTGVVKNTRGLGELK